jgi:tRNA pseudouridine55 synthase
VLLDKPAGITSHDAVQRVRRALGTRAVGHTGTLDPFATGLLVALVGRATRLARFVEGQAKTYLATARLGIATDTDDLTGTPLDPPADRATPDDISEQAVRAALNGFLGRGSQRPPAFSAKHVAGERSYQLARRGEAVELTPVPIEVFAVELLQFAGDTASFRVRVSAGTYVRGIARDLGEILGTGAHLTALRRERIGSLDVGDAVPLDRLGPDTPMLPPEAVLPDLPRQAMDDADAAAVRHGRQIPAALETTGPVALMHAHRLLAIGDVAAGMVQPRVVLEGG